MSLATVNLFESKLWVLGDHDYENGCKTNLSSGSSRVGTTGHSLTKVEFFSEMTKLLIHV